MDNKNGNNFHNWLLILATMIIFSFLPVSFKQFANALSSNYTKTTGGSLTVGDWNNLPADFVARSGGATSAMTGALDMGGNRISNLVAPTTDTDAVNRITMMNAITAANSMQNTSGTKLKMVCGETGSTWMDVPGYTNSAYISVDTTVNGTAAFTTIPIYFTSLHCTANCWRSMGSNAIYNRTTSGFQIFVQNDGDPVFLNGSSANANHWAISWCAMGY